MKPQLLMVALLLLVPCRVQADRVKPGPGENAFALVEFFTSEGCVRCRETSALAAKVVETSGGPLSRVFLLSYHVDYLNSLSWRDPYSSEAFTRRQQEYMQHLRQGAADPGSFIINGQSYLRTTSPVAMQRAINAAKAKKPRAKLTLTAEPISGVKAVAVQYQVEGLSNIRRPFFLLHVAAVQPKIEKTIPDGINAGQQFTHVNVVRSFQTQRLDATGHPQVQGRLEVVLPIELDPEDVDFIAFVQDPRSLAVLGAESVKVGASRPQ